MKKYFERRDPPMGGSPFFSSWAKPVLPLGQLRTPAVRSVQEVLCDKKETKKNRREKCNLCW